MADPTHPAVNQPSPPLLPAPLSLKGKLTVLTVGAFVVFMWALVFFSVTVLQTQFERLLLDEQFASVKRLAAELDTKLTERVAALEAVAAQIPADLRPEALDPFLSRYSALHLAFTGGNAIIGLDGKAIVDYPALAARRGAYFNDRDYFRKVLETGKPYIEKPLIGRALRRPVLTIAVPVTGPDGRLRAIFTGITDLTAPNFLGAIANPDMTGKGEFFVFSPRDHMIVAATDKSRAMTALPPAGMNLLFDRFMEGFEGSGISTSSQGIPKLYSAKGVPSSNWVVMAALPTDIAFSPVRAMERYVFGAAAVLTICALLLLRWSLRRVLAPLEEAGAAMRRMTLGEQPLAPLPIAADDEVGRLIGQFNSLVEDRRRHEDTQQRLNRALRLLSDCNMTLVRAEREQSLLDEICRLVVETGGYRMVWAGYAEPDENKTVRPVSQAGEEHSYLREVRISWGDNEYGRGPTGTAIRTGESQVYQNLLTNPNFLPWRDKAIRRGFHSSIAIPLRYGKETFGALTIYSADPDSFSEEEVKLLEELANDLAFGIGTLRSRIQREAAEAQLAFLAHYDPLTHLPNQVLLRDRFEQALAQQRQRTGVALLCLDLDNFKRINDSLGHQAGDRLLVAVVERLRGCIRETDTVSRQGGDEFVILLSGVDDSAAAGRVAQAILDAVSEPFDLGGNAVTTSFSIGISLYPNDGRDFDTMLKNADAALSHAKDSGRDTYHFFTASMNVDALARIQLHSNLRTAVKNREFVLHYQPQFDIGGTRVVGAEALLRWQRDDGLVPPGRFIPLAEETGLIVQMGEWVLQEACRQAMQWQDTGMAPITVAVNLSAQQFRRGGLLETVERALRDSGLAPQCLELELTESMLLQDAERVLETLHALKSLGVKLSIDDFGTGYSSLAYLKRLAVDKLKVDQSFVRDLADNPEDAAIVHAVIQLGHTLQLKVIAEGVETERQLASLRNYGCDEIQGYLLSKPLPAADFTAFMSRRT